MRVTLRTTIRAHDHNTGTEILDKVPARASNREEINVVVDIAEDIKSGVVLKEEIHLNADTSDVLEHVRELHVFGVGAEAIKTAEMLALTWAC
jgi:hypothetical protein